MGLADKLKNLTKKSEETVVEHKEQIHQAVEKAAVAADQRTGGKYHAQIEKAGAKADELVDRLESPEQPPRAKSTGTPDPNTGE